MRALAAQVEVSPFSLDGQLSVQRLQLTSHYRGVDRSSGRDTFTMPLGIARRAYRPMLIQSWPCDQSGKEVPLNERAKDSGQRLGLCNPD
jgi:hypothetical protein